MFAAAAARIPHVTVVIIVCVCPSSLSWLGPMRAGNPEFGNIMQLYSSTGFHLSILPSGEVQGSEEDEYKYAVLQILSLSPTEVRLYGLESKLYLAMDDKGLLYGEADPNKSATVFIVGQHSQYNIYKSKNQGWFVGIKKNGMAKPGPQTKRGQRAIQFLPRRLNR